MKKPVCVKCGKPLKDPFSIAVGMGPDCRGALSRSGWKFPKPVWRPHKSRVIFEGYRGQVEPPPLGDLTKNDREVLKRLERMKSHDHDEHEDQDTAG